MEKRIEEIEATQRTIQISGCLGCVTDWLMKG